MEATPADLDTRLEDYFDYWGPEDIRFKGHRISLEDVVRYYWDYPAPADIAQHFSSLSLE